MNSIQKFILGSIYCNNLDNGPNFDSITYLENKMNLGDVYYLDKILES